MVQSKQNKYKVKLEKKQKNIVDETWVNRRDGNGKTCVSTIFRSRTSMAFLMRREKSILMFLFSSTHTTLHCLYRQYVFFYSFWFLIVEIVCEQRKKAGRREGERKREYIKWFYLNATSMFSSYDSENGVVFVLAHLGTEKGSLFFSLFFLSSILSIQKNTGHHRTISNSNGCTK